LTLTAERGRPGSDSRARSRLRAAHLDPAALFGRPQILTICGLCDVPVWAEFTRLISAGLRRELAAGDAGLGLQQLQGPRRPPGRAQVCFPHGRFIKNPIVRNRIYRRGRGSPSLAVPYAAVPARGEGELAWTSC
jgi:hypothetical protein